MASDILSRQYPTRPYLGVGALIIKDQRLLLVERGQEPLKGYWSLPGGILETGETLEQGIRREVREETGLELERLDFFEIFQRIMPDAQGRTEYHYVLIDFICEPQGGVPQAASDVANLAWVTQHDLSNYCLTEGTLEVAERAFAKFQR